MSLTVLDLFSAAAGGWSLGMHRAGFETIAACEVVAWRRALYSENNPHVRVYDDVRTLTAAQLMGDLGRLPDVIVGSPPCQDISSANTKGKGIDGERSGLFFEAVRIIGEVRPRWFALENSSHLRTKGSDRVLGALEALDYTCWPVVVRARDVGANHERPRVWIIGCDVDQLADAENVGRPAWPGSPIHTGGADQRDKPSDLHEHSACFGHEGGRARGYGPQGLRQAPVEVGVGDSADADFPGLAFREGERRDLGAAAGQTAERDALQGDGSHAHEEGQPDGGVHGEVGGGESLGGDASEPWAEWNGGLAGHLRVDDGLSAWVAQSRIAVGGPRGTAAASLLVEAFGDAVLPQIPEAIGRAILRTEAALEAIYGGAA